jgi:hypothetical protein
MKKVKSGVRMKKRQCFAITAGITILMSVSGIAGDYETVTQRVDAEGATRIEVTCDFEAGQLWLRSGDIPDAANIEITYTPRWVSYDIDYSKRGNTGHLVLGSELRRKRSFDDVENEWQVTLSDRLPVSLDLDIGACEADLDFGGLPLEGLDLDVGASSSRVEFSKPNPVRLKEIRIETGASSLELYDLGNANFEYLTLDCGATSCDMDFRGEFSGESKVELDVGVASVDIYVPQGIGVRVETDDDGWFSSVDFQDLRLERVRKDTYESSNYARADSRLIFRVSVGMGSVDFHAER